MLLSILKVSQHGLQRAAVQLGVEPLVVEEDFGVQVGEAFGADQVERELTELETVRMKSKKLRPTGVILD